MIVKKLSKSFVLVKKIILIGHSMGGAIAIRTGFALPPGSLSMLVVLDVVEGTALDALPVTMKTVLSFPKSFTQPEEAIYWAVSNRHVRNEASACVSIPPQLVSKDGNLCWRTDLMKTSQFWKGWFDNMSKLFLSVPGPKLLVLADTNRLDKELTIAQMQGKFQMEVIGGVGHCIQEDDPHKTSAVLLQVFTRYGFVKR